MYAPALRRPAFAVASAILLGLAALAPATARSDAMSPEVKAKVEKYKQKLVEWAATPALIDAVKAANAGGALQGMTNAKWEELADTDPKVTAILTSPASKQLAKWEEDKAINKLFLRDEKGNLVAGSSKTFLFNNGARPAFQNAIKGQPWADGAVKPDPTTQIPSVQISAPVLDGGKPIGVLHSAVSAQ
jgi:C4-dicarboxylate-specific signal transduction histidine kinase